MSWITIIWAMTASACLTLALLHLHIWFGQRTRRANLAFALTAISVAVFAGFELAMMHARSPQEWSIAARWSHLPVWTFAVSLVWFVSHFFASVTRWLAWSVIGLRTLACVLNFALPGNLNLREVTGLREMNIVGDRIVAPIGTPNPLMLIAQAAMLLLVAFIADAAIREWRTGLRRRAVVVGGSTIFFVAFAAIETALVFWGAIDAPVCVSVAYLLMLIAMGLELSRDASRAARLEEELAESQRQSKLDHEYSEMEIAELREELSHMGRVSTMGQLASALAHEINQPLGAILRNAEAAEMMLNNGPPDLDELRAIVGDIRKDDHRAGDVIERLRGMLRRRDIEMGPLSVADLLNETAALVRAQAAARGVSVEIDAADDLPMVNGDRVHLQQVLLNLLLNALDAVSDVPEADGMVKVTASRSDDGKVEVAVIDRGTGIGSDALHRVFEPFFTTKAKGMGMGLPISRTIVEAHGGRIWVESNGAGGAAFRFTLKAAGATVGAS